MQLSSWAARRNVATPWSDVPSVPMPKEEPVVKSRSIAVSGGTAVQLDGVAPCRQALRRDGAAPARVPVAPPVVPMPPRGTMPRVAAMPPVAPDAARVPVAPR